MKDLLGEVDEDLADFVIEHLRDKKGPDDLVEGLEPVSRSSDSYHKHANFRSSQKKRAASSTPYGDNSSSNRQHLEPASRAGRCWCSLLEIRA